MTTIILNNKEYLINKTDMPIENYKNFNKLIIRPQIGILEKEIGLLNDLAELFNYDIINLGIRHGGYVLLETNVKNKLILDRNINSNDLHNFKKNMYKHKKNINIVDNIIDNIFDKDKIYLLRIDYTNITFSDEEYFKIIKNNNVIIVGNNKFTLKNLDKYIDNYHIYQVENSDIILYIPYKLNNKFIESFKYYFTDDGKFVYDNLINLCIMVKNAGNDFRHVLEKNLPFVDRWTFLDTGSTDNTIKIIKDVMKNKKGNLYCEPFINFRDSRNRCLDLAGQVCKFNIMLDDTYTLQGNVRDFLSYLRCDQFATSYNIFIKSNEITYGSNRIIRTEDKLRYMYKIHEIIQEKNNKLVVQIPFEQMWIHDYTNSYMNERTKNRKEKDIELLEDEITENPDIPRHLYYLAQTYRDIRLWDKAVEYYQKRVEHPVEGYREEITDSYLLIAFYGHTKLEWEWTKCEKIYLKCFNYDPGRPDALYFIGKYYIGYDNYLAYQYLKRGFEIEIPADVTSNLRPDLYNKFLPESLIPLCFQFKDYQLGWKACNRLLNYVREINDPIMVSYYNIFKLMNQNRKMFRNVGQKSILTFVANGGFNKWQGSTLNKDGVGGSETYIIEMSRNIAKITNFDVYVFCNCEEEELFEGVQYKKLETYIEFINSNKVETCIINRFSEYIHVSLANEIDNIYLVVHDLLPSGNIIPTDERLRAIFCMSEWHKSFFLQTFPMLEHKVKVFPNGINLHDYQFNQSDQNKKLNSFIYSSFPNRGLINLLKMFPKIRERLPDATLDVFCDTKNNFVQSVAKDEMDEIEILLEEQKEFVFNHGWVRKEELQKYWQQAEFWLYPCTFMETFCITALEAAASRTLVITNNLAALQNTVGDRGLVVGGDSIDSARSEKWQDDVIEQLIELIEDKSKMDELLDRNQEWSKGYDWSKLGERMVDEYLGHRIDSSVENIEKTLSVQDFESINSIDRIDRIALYHNTKIHHEMLGYLIEYCNSYNYEIDIYLIFDDENTQNWVNYYNNFSKNRIKWINSLKILDDIEYNVIFLITDDNDYFSNIDQKYYHKIISIDHFYLNRRPEIKHHICVRQFFNRHEIPYAIPTYNIILPEEKKLLLKNVSRIQVLFIGKFNIPSSLTFQFFDNFDNIDFHIVRNNEDDVFFELLVKRPNIYFHSYMSTEDLISLMKKSHYIFLMPAYVEGYPQHKLSSLISLSYSTLCQLIVPEMWNKHLRLKSVVKYCDYKYLRPNMDIKLDVSNFDSVIDNIYQERCELIEHNKNVLDNMIGIVSQKNNTSWFSQCCKVLKLQKPRIFVETGTYLGEGIENVLFDFDEIHSIELNSKFVNNAKKKFKNYYHVNIHHGDSSSILETLKINEPVIFYLDAHYSGGKTSLGIIGDNGCPLLRELSILGKRKFNDIIIIDDMRLMGKKSLSGVEGDKKYPLTEFDFRHITIEGIKESYGRKCKILNTTDIDRLIILPSVINKLNYAEMLNWSSDIPVGSKGIFESMLERFRGKECKILEIGTYVGTSVISMLKYLPDATATVIDMWKNYNENTSLNTLEENGIEEIFYENVKKAEMDSRIEILKGDSKDILKDLITKNKRYNFIYVDGSHTYLDCYNDMVSSLKLLSNNGILAIDDYLWMSENREDEKDRPYHAVNDFIEKYSDELKILHQGYRVFLLKNKIKII